MAASRFLQSIGKKEEKPKEKNQSRFLSGISSGGTGTDSRGANIKTSSTLDMPGLKGEHRADLSHVYEKYRQAKAKVAGGTANPIFTSQYGVQANRNLTEKDGETYAEARERSRKRAAELYAGLENAKGTAQEVKDILFAGRNYGTANPTYSLGKEYDTMTEEEAGVYTALAKQGRTQEAEEYLNTLQMELNQRNAEKAAQRARETAEKSTLGGVGLDVAGAMAGGTGALYSLWQEAKGEAIDPYHPAFGGAYTQEGAREGLLGDSTGAERLLKEAGLAVAEWGGQALGMGAFAPINMALGAGGAGARDAAMRDGTAEEATIYGALSGAAEMVAEKIGFDRYLGILDKIAPMKGNKTEIAKHILKQMGSEGLEEGATEIANLLADAAVMGDRSSMAAIYSEAKVKGMSEGEAILETLKQAAGQIGESFAVGALSGGAISGGLVGIDAATGRDPLARARAQYEAATRSVEDVHTSVDNGTDVLRTQEAAQKEENGQAVNPSEETKAQPTQAQAQPEAAVNEDYEAELEDYGEKFYGEKGKEAFLRRARESGNLEHTAAFNTYYRAGVAGITESKIKQTAYTAGADKMLLNEAWMAGAEDRKAMVRAAITGRSKLTGERGLILGEDVKATEEQMAITKLYADITGVRFRLVNEITEEIDGEKFSGNGYWDPNDHMITLALKTDSFMGTVHHELVHYIRTVNNVAYGSLRDIVLELAEGSGIDLTEQMGKYRERYKTAYGENQDAFEEEMVADAMQMIAEGENGIANLLNQIVEKEPSLRDRIIAFLDSVIKTLEGLLKDNTYTAFAEEISKDKENLKKLRKGFAKALTETGKIVKEADAQMKKGKAEAETQTDDVKFSVKIGMTEDERYEELKNREIIVFSDTKTKEYSKEIATIEELQKTARNSARKEIKKLAERLGILHKEMKTPEVEVEFILSGEGLRESFNKQAQYGGSYLDFAKAIANLDKIMETAVLLEEHEDKYKGTERESRVLEKVSVLFGAFRDGADIIPVQMEIKKSSTDSGRLYMTVAMTKIEAGVIETRRENPEHGSLVPTSAYRLADFFKEINVADKHFLKYVPDGFLDEAQKEAKADALRVEREKIERMKENKKITPVPPLTPAYNRKNGMATLNGGVTASATETSVAQKGNNGNNKNITKYSIGEAEYKELVEENEALQEANDALRRQFEITKGEKVDRASAKTAVRKWLREHDSKFDIDAFTDRFVNLCEYAKTVTSQEDFNQVMSSLGMLTEEALQESETLNTDLWEEYADLRERLKAAKIKITPEIEKELDYYGGYNEIRKAYFGRLNLSRKGSIAVDTLFQELAADYPEFFNEEAVSNEGDMLLKMMDALDILKPTIENPYGHDLSGYAQDAAYGLFDLFQKVRQQEPTFADKYQAKLEKVERDFQKALAKQRERDKKKWQEYNEGIKTADRLRMREEKRKERRKRTEYNRDRRTAENHARILLGWLKNPTNARHVPKKYKDCLAALLVRLDTPNKDVTILQSDIHRIINVMNQWKPLRGEDGMETHSQYDENIVTLFENLAIAIGKQGGSLKLSEMNNEQMAWLKNALANIRKNIMNENKLITAENGKTVSDMGADFIKEVKGRKKAPQALRVLQDFFGLDMLTAETFLKGVSEDVYDTFWKGLSKAQGKKALMIEEARKYMSGIITKKTARKWKEAPLQKHEIKRVDAEGQETVTTVYMTIPQMMYLYAAMRRDQARKHILLDYKMDGEIRPGGGIKIEPDRKLRLKGRKAAEEALRQTDAFQFTESEINEITNKLMNEQKHTALMMQRFLSTTAAEWGNETSMQMYGYEKFEEQNYIPIHSDRDYIQTTFGSKNESNSTLQNMGTAQNVNKHANNPIVIEDIFEVFSKHIDQMASYNAFVPILSDMNKFLNYKVLPKADEELVTKAEAEAIKATMTAEEKKAWEEIREANGDDISEQAAETEQQQEKKPNEPGSVRNSLKAILGPKAEGYFQNLMVDINNAAGKDDTGILPQKLLRNMKAASVGANLRVVVQQPTSIVRAGAVINPLYLIEAAAAGKADFEKMHQYAPISLWKDWGGADTDTGRTLNEMLTGQTLYQEISNASMWLAGWADRRTWGRIWKACELETKAKHKELDGEAFWKKVGERLTEIIDKTQVVDTTLHRSQMMRSKSYFVKMATSFMSEPTKTYNMIYDSVREMYRNPKDKEAWKRLTWTSFTLVANAVAVSAAAAIMDAMRDDDEDEAFWDKWMKAFKGDYSEAETKKDHIAAFWASNLNDNLNPMNMIPYMKDISSMIGGYDVARTDMSWATDLINWAKQMMKFMEGESKYTLNGMMLYTAGAFSKVTGLPVKSLKRDIFALKDTVINHTLGLEAVQDATGLTEKEHQELRYANRKMEYFIGSEANLKDYTKRMLEARFSGNTALATKIYNEMIENGIDNETLDKKIEDMQKETAKETEAARAGAEAIQSSDYDAYEKALDELLDAGYNKKYAEKAIDSVYNKLNGEDEEEELTFDSIDNDYWDDAEEESGEGIDFSIHKKMLRNAYRQDNSNGMKRMEKLLYGLGMEDKDINGIYRDEISKLFDEANAKGDKAECERLIQEYVKYNGKEDTLRNRAK